MSKLIIEGGIPLQGEYPLPGAKNAVLKMITAALLTAEEVVLQNVPRISDVDDLLEIIRFLGGEADWGEEHEVRIRARRITALGLPPDLAARNRTTFLTLAALLTRFGQASVPLPGGDKIGYRPVSPHIQVLTALGARIQTEKGCYVARARGKNKRLVGAAFSFRKNTHTGTECGILAASLAWGVTRLENAAQEPEIDNLVELLNQMGAKIKRVEPRVVEIEGVESLGGGEMAVMPDRVVAATIAAAVALTRGEVLIARADPAHLTAFLAKIKEIGVNFQVLPEGLKVWSERQDKWQAVNLETRPHPGLLTDWMPLTTVLLTQAQGESVVHETVHPNRLGFAHELKKMGAEVSFFNPKVVNPLEFYNFDPWTNKPEYVHALRVFGPTPLVATRLDAGDTRAGAALVLAALAAQGQSEIVGIEHLNRGYENLAANLKNLGARISLEA